MGAESELVSRNMEISSVADVVECSFGFCGFCLGERRSLEAFFWSWDVKHGDNYVNSS